MEPTLETFTAQSMDEGFDEILVREWAPGLELDTHSHAFAVSARVVRGEFWLTVDGSTRQEFLQATIAACVSRAPFTSPNAHAGFQPVLVDVALGEEAAVNQMICLAASHR